jgi:dGTPase
MTIRTKHRNLIEDMIRREEELVTPFGCRSSDSRGREVEESPHWLRTEFQRDRDRIIHCNAFRKLEYKTQVYVTHTGDMFRTRLTHTLEVAQIARTMAMALRINPDLTEAIALGHDLGHTPFGHAGETVMNELLAGSGGFEHNDQSLRVVELLEQRFHDRPGLNLTFEVRAGIACHSTAYDKPSINAYNEDGSAPYLEAQLVDLSDQIAFNSHDIDDALSMGILKEDQLSDVPWVWELWESARGKIPEHCRDSFGRYRALGMLIDCMVDDVLETALSNLDACGELNSPDDIRNLKKPVVNFSEGMSRKQQELRDFLMEAVYSHPITLRMTRKAARFLKDLFELYKQNPELLPFDMQNRIEEWGLDRALTDYISSMTDRHCIKEYISHFRPTT